MGLGDVVRDDDDDALDPTVEVVASAKAAANVVPADAAVDVLEEPDLEESTGGLLIFGKWLMVVFVVKAGLVVIIEAGFLSSTNGKVVVVAAAAVANGGRKEDATGPDISPMVTLGGTLCWVWITGVPIFLFSKSSCIRFHSLSK